MRRGFTLVELLVVIVIIAALAGLTAPMVIRQRHKADQTEAVNNAHQIGIAMLEFDTEYGSYPDAATADAVATATGKTKVSGTDANGMFRQIFSAGLVQSEAIFYAKTAYTNKPDGVTTLETDFLKKGECAFGYIMKGATTTAFSSSGNAGRPIIATPLKKTMDGTFDSDYYDGKAVVLKVDNSITSLVISTTSFKPILNGKDLLTNGADTVWGTTDTPVLNNPDPK